MEQLDFSRIADLRIKRINDAMGGIERLDYEWNGPPEVLISHELLSELGTERMEKTIQLGPYRLALMDDYPRRGMSHYVRMDYPLWRLRIFGHRGLKWLEGIYRRSVLKLAMWNLAKVHEGMEPSWRDIRGMPRMKYLSASKDGAYVDAWLNGRKVSQWTHTAFVPEKAGQWWLGYVDMYRTDKEGNFEVDPILDFILSDRHHGFVKWESCA
jgi:hypothetical protein